MLKYQKDIKVQNSLASFRSLNDPLRPRGRDPYPPISGCKFRIYQSNEVFILSTPQQKEKKGFTGFFYLLVIYTHHANSIRLRNMKSLGKKVSAFTNFDLPSLNELDKLYEKLKFLSKSEIRV